MNVTNLILNLKAMITDNTLDQAMVSKAIKLLELGAVYQADTFASLPTPSAANAGQLYYILYDGLYWSTGEFWIPITKSSIQLIYSWGSNSLGQLGDNSPVSISRSSPVQVAGGFTDWCHVATTTGAHALGIRSNGTAWGWGGNISGQLGDNCNISRSSPVQVVGFAEWCQLSAGGNHSLGVRTNGTAWAWGSNTTGRLGDGTIIGRSSPVPVIGGFTDWRQLSAGGGHSVGVRANGTIWAWGCNNFGQLGDNTITSRSSPVNASLSFTDWCQVAAGTSHSLGVRCEGTAWAWGLGTSGRLGDNTTISRRSPVQVVGGFTNWCQLSAGDEHSLGVRTDGTAWAWGGNFRGHLGNNNTINRSSPVSVVGGFTDWCQVAAGTSQSRGLRTNGTAWSWGYNAQGRLGDNTTINRSSPVSVVGGFTWIQISQINGIIDKLI